jgi:hypothetical protein
VRAPACTAAVSQHRRINLPVSHGAYVNGKPLMIKTDRTPDTIPYCGVCSSQNNPGSNNISLTGENGRGQSPAGSVARIS